MNATSMLKDRLDVGVHVYNLHILTSHLDLHYKGISNYIKSIKEVNYDLRYSCKAKSELLTRFVLIIYSLYIVDMALTRKDH